LYRGARTIRISTAPFCPPAGALLAHCLGIVVFGSASFIAFNAITVPYALIAVGFCFGIAVYYLVWKYIVGFLNGVLGIA
jgi:hypothetical protein